MHAHVLEEHLLLLAREVGDLAFQPDEAVRRLAGPEYGFFVLNYANADMVGQTGVYDATVQACRVVDECVGRVVNEALSLGGSALVTADHGNAEQMLDPVNGGPHTAHTLNPVPAILATPGLAAATGATLRSGGTLADIAPTLLSLLKIPQPPEMTGRDLLVL